MRGRLILLVALALALPASAQAPDLAQIDREIERLRRELVRLGRAEQSGEGLAEGQRAKLIELNAREAAVKTRIDANRAELAKLLGALQMYSRRPPPPLLVNPRSARDAVRAAILIRAVTPELEARGKAFSAQADSIRRLRRSVASASATLFQTESEIADHRAQIDRLLAEKQALEHQAFPDSAPEVRARALAARSGSVGELVEGLSAGAAGGGAAPTQLSPPVQGVLVRRFGQAGGEHGRAQGWTWRAPPGAPVLSPGAGRIDYAGPLKGWGEVAIINVGAGHRLVLAGLGGVAVAPGRAVAAGEPIGRMGPGAEGGRVPPEIYLEVRQNAAAVDPARWLSASAARRPNTATP